MEKSLTLKKNVIFLVFIMFSTFGCSELYYQKFKVMYNSGDFLDASQYITESQPDLMKEDVPAEDKDLLGALYLGTSLQAEGRFAESIQAFDIADELLNWRSNTISSVSDFLETLKEIFLSGLLYRPAYTGNLYEGILVNTYKGMNYMYMGNFANARVEFNRAQERQENAVDQLAYRTSTVDDIKTDTTVADESENTVDVDRERQQHIQSVYLSMREEEEIQKRLEAVKGLQQYKDLRNPFTDYTHGVFRMVTGDFNLASNLLRDARVLQENNPYLLEDFKLAEQAAQSFTPTPIQRIWVIFEDGIGPSLIPFTVRHVDYFEDNRIVSVFSLPEFKRGKDAWRNISIIADDTEYRTTLLLDVDDYAAFEFNANYNTILFKTVSSILLKRLLQYTGRQMSEEGGSILAIIGGIVRFWAWLNEVTAVADTRSWDVLPHSVNIASIPLPENKTIEIKAGQRLELVELPDTDFVLIYVKAVNRISPLSIYVKGFSSPSS